jgi:hypothetical protein
VQVFIRSAQKSLPESIHSIRGGFLLEDPGDNRLSRQRHYHGPGGLNGRVRNGNGCDPASMVAGNVPGRRSSAAGHWVSALVAQRGTYPLANEWLLLHDILSNEPYGMARQSVDGLFRLAFPFCLLPFYFCLLAFGMQVDGSAPIGVVKLLGC